MKITVLLPRFAITGVPLAQVRFARALAARGHKVTLVVGFVDASFTLPALNDVTVVCWHSPKVRGMFWPLMRYLRVEKPDVVFSAEDHLNTLVLIAAVLAGSKSKISGSSRVTPFDTYSNTLFSKRWILKQLTQMMMWRADALTCVSQGTVEEYRKVFKNPPHVCVYNIVDDSDSRSKINEAIDHKWFHNDRIPVLVAAGQLAPWKGYADLIHAMKHVLIRREVRLIILGDGPLKDELQILIDDLDLTTNIELLGYVHNPLKYFSKSNLFVHAAHVESLGNVLVEAMMCGCTPVSTDCPTGPREVLSDGKYGYLVPMCDAEAMAAAIVQALDAPIPKATLAEGVVRFEEARVIARHFELLGLCEKSST